MTQYLSLWICAALVINLRGSEVSEDRIDDNELEEHFHDDYDDKWPSERYYYDEYLNKNSIEKQHRSKRYLRRILKPYRNIRFYNRWSIPVVIQCGFERGDQKNVPLIILPKYSVQYTIIALFFSEPPLWCTMMSNKTIMHFKAYGSGDPDAPTHKELDYIINQSGLFLNSMWVKMWLPLSPQFENHTSGTTSEKAPGTLNNGNVSISEVYQITLKH